MRIGALSGMRIEEICSLTVANCNGGVFRIETAKSEAGVREVPINSGLTKIVERRCQGNAQGDWLIDQLPPIPPSRQADNRRSDPATKSFTQDRRNLGVDEVASGARQSNIDFHLFRRWFVTKAEIALQSGATGFTPWTAIGSKESLP